MGTPTDSVGANAVRVAIRRESDIVAARREGRRLGLQLGFSATELTLLTAAITEVARNIVVYAQTGELWLELLSDGARRGLKVTARDEGPGIADVPSALRDGVSSIGNMGLGLPGARRVVDELTVDSAPGRGTTVTLVKWVRA